MNELIKNQKKKRKEASGIAAIIMALLPYIFFALLIGLAKLGIMTNTVIIVIMIIVSIIDLIYGLTECIRGIMFIKEKGLFILALIINLITVVLLKAYFKS